MGAEPGPRREVVTARPRTERGGLPLPRPANPPGTGPAAPADDTAVTALMRRQMRAALTATALLVASLGLLPVLLRLLPLAGAGPSVPLAVWLVLGVAPYPALLCTGAWYVRRAERNEGDVTAR
ncbi:hypothetical protein AQI88_01015 [Streptomyces cellostaticus]|uniref:DUF485 domain-containing protein n=1 Tax=Streptomyces cellostaticus TaxID=67285 RepID=A0A101NTG5_9ACTN|nr:hypothetical protein [Streptomyces cellostaticus]KUM98862.1 hypothetical protein AQI88_01015 [Streptomyces cellostaticus]GHI03331.1 hypothetical protein Scel_16520 [Streptomyces cellostaticus]